MPEGSFKGIFDAAKKEVPEKSESQTSEKSESQTSKLVDEKKANLCIKIPVSLRNYWIGSARTEGTTVTAVLTQYLSERYGTPDDPRKPKRD